MGLLGDTAWHLSYIVIASSLAPVIHWERVVATLLAFFLGLGISAHFLDEMRGHPLRTKIPDRALLLLAILALVGAITIGLVVMIAVTPWLIIFIAFGTFITLAYNLELFGSKFHEPSQFWFPLAWGAFPALTAYYVNSVKIDATAIAVAAFCFAMSYVQRALSLPVRRIRRRASAVRGEVTYPDGTKEPVSDYILAVPESGLKALSLAVPLLAVALVIYRLGL